MQNISDRVVRRAGVIGDIHAEDEALGRVLEHFSKLDLDTLLAVGDMVDGGGDANRVCSLLEQHNVFAVAGNHDRWILKNSMRELPDAQKIDSLNKETLIWLEQLPKTRSFGTPRGRLLLCHGMGEDDMAALRPHDEGYALEANIALSKLIKSNQYRFVVNGHTHEAMVKTVQQVTIINAGTLDRYDRQVCCAIDFNTGGVTFFDVAQDAIVVGESYELR